MIEVEKKFSLTPDQMKRIEESAEFVKEVINTDIYYDTPNYDLMRKNHHLRIRNGEWELKVPIGKKNSANTVFEELTDVDEIFKQLNLKQLSGNLEENLKQNGFEILAKLVTKHRKFKIQEFNIDVDEVDYGYSLCEIEKMVENEGEVEKATKEIFDLAGTLGLEIKKVRGKGMEYFFRFNPEAYKIYESVRYE
ncbi:MAG: CYTH domain-containing protein [Patescibacteria group bacterium]